MTITTSASEEVTTAEIKHECETPKVAKLTPELSEILETVETGDLAKVGYVSVSGLTVHMHGRVTDVDRPSGDLRISTMNGEAYLHVNPRNGTYYFSDDFGNDELSVESVTLRHV